MIVVDEKAHEVIENEISYFVGQSQKRTDSTIEVLKSLSELENAEASKPTIQLPKVAHLNVDFEPLLMQAQVRVIKGFISLTFYHRISMPMHFPYAVNITLYQL